MTASSALDLQLAEDATRLDALLAELAAEDAAAMAPFRAQIDEDCRELDRILADLAADLGPFDSPTSTAPP